MGVSYFLVAKEKQSRAAEAGPNIGGKPLAKAHDDLSPVLQAAGVPDLMEYFSADPAEVEAMLGEELDDVQPPPEQWFEPTLLLLPVTTLLAHLRKTPEFVPRQNDVISDLEEMERVLLLAAEEKTLVHLAMDI
jgi:hypothetical protein